MAGDKNSPFVTVKVKCPVCTRESPQRYVKSKLFTPVEVESDQHVISYKWESPRFEGIRPNFYHIWLCPFCHFADEKEVMRGGDDSGGKLELIREKVLISSKAPHSFISRMGEATNLADEYLTLESALCAHLLAIHIQEFLSPNMRQFGKLGRFYLRVAWLYREKKTWNVPETNLPPGYARLEDFFLNLKEEWPEMPLSEEAAMLKAIEYYQSELDHGKRVDDVRHEVAVQFLLADLNLRSGRRNDALNLIRMIFQQATQKRQTTRQVLDIAISKGKGSQEKIEQLRSLITWLNNSIDRTTELSEKLSDEIFAEEYAGAREFVLSMKEPSIENLVEGLRARKFNDVTIRRIAVMFNNRILASRENSGDIVPDDTNAEQKKSGKSGNLWESIKNIFQNR